jgi:HD-GYP domain-containing protein (c-di-GMP phosphodiesterase class II)
MLQTNTPTSTRSTPADASSFLPAVLDSLAARLRPGGLFLMFVSPDGAVSYQDQSAGLFFERYVLPLVQYAPDAAAGTDAGRPAVVDLTKSITAASPVTVWPAAIPGVSLAAFPHIERRQQAGVVLIAAKSTTFKLGDDIGRLCGTLGLDAVWLSQQADELPAYGEEAIQRQARLLLAMLRDQVRLTGMESELTSLSGQLSNTYEELSLIYQLSSGMRVNRGPADFFKQACLDVMDVMNVRGMGVALGGESFASYEPVLYGPLSLPPGTIKRLATELLHVMTERQSPLLVNDLAADKTFHWLGDYTRNLLVVPLQRQDEVLGCFFALDKPHDDFDSQDSKLLNSIANESAIFLENARLFDDVHGLMMGLLHSLTSAVDAKDAYTCGHSERVALIAKRLTLEAGLGDALAERVYMAGLLHDVGKIGVPEAVLQKTGRLTPEEFEHMKKHPGIGAKILADIKQLRDIIPGVLHHHERFDGKGYPTGLAGENIPIMGRLICLADCFDAMTSNRTYRKALPLEVALAEICRCGGTQFDPVLTESFLKIGAEGFRALLQLHQDRAAAA